MKLSTALGWMFLVANAASSAVFAQETAPQSPADKAFAEVRAVSSAPYTIMNDHDRWEKMNREERERLSAAATELVVPLANKFFDDFPTDPRRWQVAGILLNLSRRFSGPDAGEQKAAWEKRRTALQEQLLTASDADENVVASIMERGIYDALGGLRGRGERLADLAKAAELVERMGRRVPGSDRRRFAERHYLEALEKADPTTVESHLRRRATEKDVNPALAAQSEGMLRIITARREPLELSFTALDGSAVNLADYRGKVVLIDFWATWCVPCMEEMPNVKKVYSTFHDKGFEVIGISLDAAPRDPANPRKHEKTAEQVKQFLVRENMPWPQHYDGKWWENAYSRRFALGSIPATFLLGKDGRIFSTANKGEKLEQNVRKLLGL